MVHLFQKPEQHKSLESSSMEVGSNFVESYYANAIKSQSDMLDSFRKDPVGRLGSVPRLSSDYITIANAELTVKHDIPATLVQLYKAGRSSHFALRLCLDKYPQYAWQSSPNSFNFCDILHKAITSFVLCDRWAEMKLFIQDFEQDPNRDWASKRKIFSTIGQTAKHFFLSNMDAAKGALDTMHLHVKSWNGFEGLIFVIAGILHNDATLIDKAISEEIKRFRRESGSNKYIKLSAISATAWIKLARHYGFDPETSDKLIHKGLLVADTSLPYEDVYELYSIYRVPPLS